MVSDGFGIRVSRFAHYGLANAALEELAEEFRWIEGLVRMGDADCLLFRVSNLTFGGISKSRSSIGGSHTLYAIFLARRGALSP